MFARTTHKKPHYFKGLISMFYNIGPSERKLRIMVGLAFLAAGFAAPIPEQWHLASFSIAVPFLFSAALGFCPFKALLLRKLS
jgi:hypothetical protein